MVAILKATTIIGILFILSSILVAGDWFYIPFSMNPEDYEPIAIFPEGDPADYVYHSNITYIPSKDMYYIEWNYVWLDAGGHTPDTERVRIYIKDGKLHHISLSIHYKWMDVYDYKKEGNHVYIYFTPVYHTPYTTPQSYIELGIERILPIAILFVIGLILILADRIKWKKPSL